MCLPGQPILLGPSIMSSRLPYLCSIAQDTAVHCVGLSLPFHALVICLVLDITFNLFFVVVVVFGFNYIYTRISPGVIYYYIILQVILYFFYETKGLSGEGLLPDNAPRYINVLCNYCLIAALPFIARCTAIS